MRKGAGILTALLIIAISIAAMRPAAVYGAEVKSAFWIQFIDVGQGDCALIQCDGHYMLIDGGPPKASSKLFSILRNKKVDTLDYMIATHPDADHIGGLSAALNYSAVNKCYCPTVSYDTKTFANMEKYLKRQNKSITIPKAGEAFLLGKAKVEILGPIYEAEDSNNNSIIVKITYGDNRFIFMGDAETKEEASVIAARKDLNCDLIKIAHHGSLSSTSESLLKAVNPDYAIISVAADNSYGHPKQQILNRLDKMDITVYRTDVRGDILCNCDGKRLSFEFSKKVDAPSDIVANSSALKTETGKDYNKDNTSNDGNIDDAATDGRTQDNKAEDDKSEDNKSVEADYVLNTNTRKFHYPSCSSVNDMSPKNKKEVRMTRDEIIAQGYKGCQRCNP